MLSIMEQYWINARLDRHYALPENRGWMNTFRRWSQTEAFQQFWPVLQGTYHPGFTRFCHSALNLPSYPKLIDPLEQYEFERDYPPWLRKNLVAEYNREWTFPLLTYDDRTHEYILPKPEDFDSTGRHFQQRLVYDLDRALENAVKAWYLTLVPADMITLSQQQGLPRGTFVPRYPCGVVLLLPEGNDLQLLMWIRGACRSSGIGRDNMTHLMPVIEKEVFGQSILWGAAWNRLVVHLPARDESPAERMQLLQWLNFFYDFNFRRRRAKKTHPRVITLELNM
jgi:hypothetical protein